jgi:hypothetical protein
MVEALVVHMVVAVAAAQEQWVELVAQRELTQVVLAVLVLRLLLLALLFIILVVEAVEAMAAPMVLEEMAVVAQGLD